MVKLVNTHVFKAFLFLCLLVSLNVLSVVAQEDNLLANPGFEDPYVTVPGNPDMLVAEGWTPWHNPRTEDMESFRNAQPEYRGTAPDNTRIRTGENAQVFFSTWLTHEGGVFQSVSGITPDKEYLFSVYAYVWSNDFDDEESRQSSANPGGITLQVGIDPLGGTDPNSENIVWSVAVEQYDAYRQYSINARSASETVTVWVRSRVAFPQANNFIYLDDASLTVSLDQGIVTEPPATSEPLATNTPAPTNTSEAVDPTPTPEGATNTPAPTNTIAPTNTEVPTNTTIPPTNTEVPTNTAVPTNTSLPSNTPLPTQTAIIGDPTPTPEGGNIILTNTPQPPVATNTPQPPVSTNTPQPPVPTNTPDGSVVLATSTPRPAGTPVAIGGPFGSFPNTLLHTVRRGDTVGRLAVLYGSTIEAIAAANSLDENYLIYVGQGLAIPVPIAPPATSTPSATPTATVTPTPTATVEIGIIPVQPPNNQPANTYTVQRGDTLGRIATRFNTTVSAFAQLNGITNPNRIFVGQVLIIPPTGGAISQPNTVIVVVVTATPLPPVPQPPTSGKTYQVTYGDTLYRIAVQFKVTVADLIRVNPNISNRNLIFVGQVINLP